ncbi:MAG: quinol oxidase [Acidobacteriaceae bacterium]|nr:quinol oxidase [Acidobacteriaceae bacterium]
MPSKRMICIPACGAVAALAFLNSSLACASTADAQPQLVEIHAKKYSYDPPELTLHKGASYKLHVTSDDVPHSLRIKALHVNAVAKPGQFDDVLFTPDQVGDFKADCGVYCGSGHMKMAMTVHVVE